MFHRLPDVADAHAGIKQHGPLSARDEVRNDFFRLVRLVDGEHSGPDSIDFKPFAGNGGSFPFFVLGGGGSGGPPPRFGRGGGGQAKDQAKTRPLFSFLEVSFAAPRGGV